MKDRNAHGGKLIKKLRASLYENSVQKYVNSKKTTSFYTFYRQILTSASTINIQLTNLAFAVILLAFSPVLGQPTSYMNSHMLPRLNCYMTGRSGARSAGREDGVVRQG